MKHILKKMTMVMGMLALLVAFTLQTTNVKADSAYMTVLSTDCNNATVSFAGLVAGYASESSSRIVTSIDVVLSTISNNDAWHCYGADPAVSNVVYFKNLTPGETYWVEVKPHYYFASEGNIGAGYVGYESISFTATGTSSAGASTPTVADTTTPEISTPEPTVVAPEVTIKKVQMNQGTVVVSTTNALCKGLEIKLCNKSGKTVKKDDVMTTGTTFYSVSAKQVYYAQVRSYVYDSNYNKVYSKWSAKKYVAPQPDYIKSKCKNKKLYYNLAWKKVTGAKSYTVYGRRHGSGKYKKIKTVKGTSLKIYSVAGKKYKFDTTGYDFKIVTNAKVGSKSFKSGSAYAVHAYGYYVYY